MESMEWDRITREPSRLTGTEGEGRIFLAPIQEAFQPCHLPRTDKVDTGEWVWGVCAGWGDE